MLHKKTLLGLCAVLIFAFFACFPLFGKGFIPTHDGEYHIIRFIEFFRMLSAGYWFPKWAPDMNSGYGIPIFLFHYPLPNYIGAFFQAAGFQAVTAFKLALAFGFIVSSIGAYYWLKKLFGVKAAVTGTIVGLFVPYWFIELYVRGTVGEVWAVTFLFISLAACEYGQPILYALAVAGIVLAHNILAALFIPFLFLYALWRSKRYVWWILCGVLLSSYFWIPAIIEKSYVVGLNTVRVQDHFAQLYELLIPSWGTELSGQSMENNKISFQIGIVPLLVLVLYIFILIKSSKERQSFFYWFFPIVIFLCSLLMVSVSTVIWNIVQPLGFIQYPWRLLVFLIPTVSFMAAYVSSHIRMRFLSVAIILLSVVLSYSYARPVIYAPRNDSYYLSRRNFTDGTSSMGNSFSTIWTGWKSKRPDYLIEVINGKVIGGIQPNLFLKRIFTIFTESAAEVHMPILYYPGWKVSIDKDELPINFKLDGTIRFSVPSGKHRTSVVFTQTPIRKCADILSIVTLVWLTGWGILGIYENRNRRFTPHRRPSKPRNRNIH